MSRATKVTKNARRVRLSAFRHQSESHSLSAMPCSCSRNESTANRHRKGTYAVPLHSSPCGHQNGADKTIASVLFQKTHSSAPEQRENLSLQISPTPSFGRDPDKTDTAVSTIVTEWDLHKLLFSLMPWVSLPTGKILAKGKFLLVGIIDTYQLAKSNRTLQRGDNALP